MLKEKAWEDVGAMVNIISQLWLLNLAKIPTLPQPGKYIGITGSVTITEFYKSYLIHYYLYHIQVYNKKEGTLTPGDLNGKLFMQCHWNPITLVLRRSRKSLLYEYLKPGDFSRNLIPTSCFENLNWRFSNSLMQ